MLKEARRGRRYKARDGPRPPAQGKYIQEGGEVADHLPQAFKRGGASNLP